MARRRGAILAATGRKLLADMSSGNADSSRVDDLNGESWAATQRDPKVALQLALEARGCAESAGYQSGLAESELNAGWALIYLGSYDQAIPYLYASRELFLQIDDHVGLMKVLNALGAVDHRIGETELAGELFRQSLDLAREHGDSERRVSALNNLAELDADLGRHDDAESHIREAIEIAESSAVSSAMPALMVSLGRILREKAEFDDAEQVIRSGLSLALEQSDRVVEADALAELGRVCVAKAAPDTADFEVLAEQAEANLMQSASICKEIDHVPGLIVAVNQLGALYVDLGRLEEARVRLEEVLGLEERMEAPRSTLAAYGKLADRYEEKGDIATALAIQRRIAEAQGQMLGRGGTRRIEALRAQHELERARSDAELFRLRSVELRDRSEELTRSYRQLQLMNQIGRQLTSSLDMDEITNQVHARLNELMDASVFGIAVLDESGETLDFTLVIERGQRITPFSQSVHSTNSFGSWVVRNRSVVWLNDADTEYREYLSSRKPFTHRNAKSLVFLPLEVEQRIVGVLTVQSFQKNAYTKEIVQMLELLSSYIAVALDNSSQHSRIRELNAEVTREKRELELAYERIAHMANHDNLTQLPNRRLLTELIAEYLPLAQRQNRRFGVLYVDLDDFKPVNDTLGHNAGDRVLVTVAERLRDLVRSSDTVARLGGDEFVLVVKEITEESIQTIASKVLERIGEPVSVGDRDFTLTASIGISIYPLHGTTYDELLAAADRAMYQVKQTGKRGIAMARDGYGSLAAN